MRKKLMYAFLLAIIQQQRLGTRFQDVREPETLGLGRRMHVLVRDAPDIHRVQVIRDIAQRPVLRGLRRLADALRPQYPVDVVRLGAVDEPVSLRIERADVIAV